MASSKQARLVRTIILASLLVGAALWYLANVLEADPDELISFAGSSLIMVVSLAGLALLFVALMKGVRYIARRKRD